MCLALRSRWRLSLSPAAVARESVAGTSYGCSLYSFLAGGGDESDDDEFVVLVRLKIAILAEQGEDVVYIASHTEGFGLRGTTSAGRGGRYSNTR